jgi:sec-independent protein translocase protein TatA
MFRNPTTDLIVVLVIVLLILGPKRLPGLGKSLGQGMREFKDSISGDSKDDDDQKPAITPASTVSDPPSASRSESTTTSGQGSEVGSERRS